LCAIFVQNEVEKTGRRTHISACWKHELERECRRPTASRATALTLFSQLRQQ